MSLLCFFQPVQRGDARFCVCGFSSIWLLSFLSFVFNLTLLISCLVRDGDFNYDVVTSAQRATPESPAALETVTGTIAYDDEDETSGA